MSDEPSPEPEKPRRRKQEKLGEEQKAALREILRRDDVKNDDGTINVKLVERLSGCGYGQVYNFIRRDSYLKALLPEANTGTAPTEVALIDQPPSPIGVTLTKQQFEEYQAIVRQHKKMLAGDWESLGVTAEQAARMEHYGTLGSAPVSGVMRLTSGQLISNLSILDQVIKSDAERILLGKLPAEEGKDGEGRDPELVEREWRHTLFQGMRLQLDMFSHVHKVQAVMARVAADLQKINGPRDGSKTGQFRSRGAGS